MNAIYIVIDKVRGSAPRDAGTAMQVSETSTQGTIGGGALEHRAVSRARALLAEGREARQTVPLGPRLGQCCGGAVSLRFTYKPHPFDIPQRTHPLPTNENRHLWLWGAGHVGRAVVRLAAQTDTHITWIDYAPERFPSTPPPNTHIVPAQDMPRLAASAERHADHLIFTYSHEIDLALCAALLRRGVRSIGLIGSDTKWARFAKRLREMGLDPSPITCPIGDKARGKHPDAIAHSTLEHLLAQTGVTA